jgi:TolB-like protein/Flp pilus assembly protein TadD
MSFISELKRRNVIRVGIAYLTIAWLLIEVSNTILPLFGFGPLASRWLVIVLAVAFGPVLIFTWAFEFTPEGLKRDQDVDQSASYVTATHKRLDRIVIALLGIALAYFAFDKFVLSPGRDLAMVEKARETAAFEAVENARAIEFDHSIAVLSFVNSSGDPSNDYLSEGVSDELRDHLAQLPGLRVVARSSSIRYRDRDMDAAAMAKALGVSRIIEGRFNRQGNRIRLSVQLIDGTSGFQLWSQSFERGSSDVLLLEQDLARAIAMQITPELEVGNAVVAPSAQQVSAHDLLLLGRQFEQQVTDQQLVDEAALQKAVEYYRRAIEQDPQFAEAHARLGKMLLYVGDVDAAEEPIFEALKLDSQLSDAHASLGLYYWITRQPGIGAAYQRAIELNPNNADALAYFASWAWLQGDTVLAAQYYRLARDVDPLTLLRHAELGYKLAFEGQRVEAEQIVTRILELFPNAPGYLAAARIAEAYGAIDQAIAFALKARLLRPEDPDISGQLAELHARIGDFDSAALFEPEPGMGQLFWQRRYPELIDLGEQLMIDQPDDLDVLFLLAFALNAEGRFDESLRVLESAGMPETALSESRRANELLALPTYISALQAVGDTGRADELAEWHLAISDKFRAGNSEIAWATNLLSACLESILDNDDEALAWIDSLATIETIAWLPWLQDHACFRKYRDNPRYRSVVTNLQTRLSAIRRRLPTTLEQQGLRAPAEDQK